MKISSHIQTWTLVVTMLVGASIALSDPQMSVLSTGSSSPSHGEVHLTRDREQSAVLHSLKTIVMQVFSFEGGGQGLHWPKLELNWRLVLAVLLGSVGASLCSAGGVGGGGLFIPLFNLLLGFDAKSAAALSNFMILGGSIANVGWNITQEHPHHSGHPLVDFDVALLLQPNMLLGISLGVICNVVFPPWFIILEFIITLGYITRRSFRSGMLRWRYETILAAEEKGKSILSIDAQERGQILVQKRSSSYNVLTGKFVKFFHWTKSELRARQEDLGLHMLFRCGSNTSMYEWEDSRQSFGIWMQVVFLKNPMWHLLNCWKG